MPPACDMLDAAIAEWRREGAPQEAALGADRARLMQRIDLNGMGPLLALTSDLAELPEDLARALQQRLLAREMWEEQHKRILIQALDALTGAGLDPILMKGTALAYSHYPRPSARVRGDSDILVEEGGRARAFDALEKAGFCRALTAGGTTVTAEALFQKADLAGQDHDIDLHWRLNSSPVVASLFSHSELLARTQPIETLQPAARRLCDVDALLFAAVHRRLHIDRATHIYLNGVAHPVIDSLTWLADIDVLTGAMDRKMRQELVDRALSKAVADILCDALRQAAARLGTPVEADIMERLEMQPRGDVSLFIEAGPLRRLILNLSSISSPGRRAIFLRELLFPPEDYMRARFARGRFDWRPVLHARRILPGMVKHLLGRQGHP